MRATDREVGLAGHEDAHGEALADVRAPGRGEVAQDPFLVTHFDQNALLSDQNGLF